MKARFKAEFFGVVRRKHSHDWLILGLLLLLLVTLSPFKAEAASQPGAVDPTFRSGGGFSFSVLGIAVQADGKILVVGQFNTYNSNYRSKIVRLNPDGTLDSAFDAGSGPNDTVNVVALQSDGKIIIGGAFTSYNGTTRNYLARLNANGSLDTTFDPVAGFDSYVQSITVQNDGKILVGGYFTTYNGTDRNRLARLNTDGSLDNSFDSSVGGNDTVNSIVVQSDGKILIGGFFTTYNGTTANRIARLNADGSLDNSFNSGTGADNGLNKIVLQSDGKILIGGSFTNYNGTARNYLARLNANGSLDNSFNPGSGADNLISTVELQSDGKIIIGGSFTNYNNVAQNFIARVNSNGSLDSSFNSGTGADNFVGALVAQSNGKILVGGGFTAYNGLGANRFMRLNSDGTADSTLPLGGSGANADIQAAVVQSDDKIIIGGYFTAYNGTNRTRIARLNPDGLLDTAFNPGTGPNDILATMTVQNDSKILIGGYFTSYNGTPRNRIARLNADGSLDTAFNPGTGASSSVKTIVLQSDGKIIIGGLFTNYNGTSRTRIARLNADGSLDTAFNPGTGANGAVAAIALQSNGKIIIGGSFTSYNGTNRNRIARLNADGSLDTAFNPSTGANGEVVAIALQSDGKIIIGGNFTSFAGVGRGYIARLNSNGTLDTAFDSSTGANDYIQAMLLGSDGKIIIGGGFTSYNGTTRTRIARLNSNGSLDTVFDSGRGADSTVNAIAAQSDGKVIVAGSFYSVDTWTRSGLARLENKPGSDITLTSSPNPSTLGSSVTFTATVAPITATGSVQFSFGGSVNALITGTLTNGLATYVTNTLPLGTTPVSVTYSGDANFQPSTSVPYSQTVVVPCNPLIVTNPSDDGAASTCGTFSYALTVVTNSQVITFALTAGNTITFTGSLTPTVPPGVTLDGGPNGIILEGNGVSGDGLQLAGSDTLLNITVRHFAGREIVTLGTNNKFWRVRVES